ncbi:LIP [Symbiodinium sp. CCMP2592]|nr:LIP [Symbiodinium sp. CCMP2592]
MKGFAAGYDEIRPEIFRAVRQLGCSSLVFTGHSLGAAIVTQAALEARACHHFTTSVWTYGMPRVGNKAFVEAFVATAADMHQLPPMWRVVRDFDLIPQVPPRWLGYWHIPWAVRYLKGDAEWKICQEKFEDPDCSYPGGAMADHHDYFGVVGTDENEASEKCVSSVSMQQKHRQRRSWMLWLEFLAGSCSVLCICCCFFCCGPCSCLRCAGTCSVFGSEESESVVDTEGTDSCSLLQHT